MPPLFTIQPEQPKEPADSTTSIEIWLGRTLRIGVSIAALVILTGVVVFLIRERHDVSVDQALGRGETIRSLTPGIIWSGLKHGSARAIIELGILALILTPIVRVAMTALLFYRQRDWVFIASALFVLAILLLGLVGIGA